MPSSFPAELVQNERRERAKQKRTGVRVSTLITFDCRQFSFFYEDDGTCPETPVCGQYGCLPILPRICGTEAAIR
ncbi:hypothetical protein GWI33_007664 [Rhynchophorus ferrugineus]|uniref:Uncharacterized protein n=1 Tax=Rhynchophorus ferrugineus TaxID=354439 RepID=A0A834IDZ6_RHYFE|nr:hypothetical protein GWI33_007664 [Rhynchophorus ferrugineus]